MVLGNQNLGEQWSQFDTVKILYRHRKDTVMRKKTYNLTGDTEGDTITQDVVEIW